MKRAGALTIALAVCAVLLTGCGHLRDRAARDGRPGHTTSQNNGGTNGAGNQGTTSTDPATVSSQVSTDLDDIDTLLKDLDNQQAEADRALPDAD
jgi:negative regulator of sigma E activity